MRPGLACWLLGVTTALAALALAPAGGERTVIRVDHAPPGTSRLVVVAGRFDAARKPSAPVDTAAARAQRRLSWRAEIARHYQAQGTRAGEDTAEPPAGVRMAAWRGRGVERRPTASDDPAHPAYWNAYWSRVEADAEQCLDRLARSGRTPEGRAAPRSPSDAAPGLPQHAVDGQGRRPRPSVQPIALVAGPPAVGWIVVAAVLGGVAARVRWALARVPVGRCWAAAGANVLEANGLEANGLEANGWEANGASRSIPAEREREAEPEVVRLQVPASWVRMSHPERQGARLMDAGAGAVLLTLGLSLAVRLGGQPLAVSRLLWWPLAEIAALWGG